MVRGKMTQRWVVTGPDGCGKTAVVKACALALRDQGIEVGTLSIWDAFRTQSHFKSSQEILGYLAGLSGWPRVHFLQHGLAVLSQLVEASVAEVLLIDGYWYKYFLAEAAHQPRLYIQEGLFLHLASVDQVFYLDTPLALIVDRKQTFSPYECGGYKANRESFLAFQAPLHQRWWQYVETKNDWEILSGEGRPEHIADIMMERIFVHA